MSWTSWYTGVDTAEDQRRSDAADADLARENAADLASGHYDAGTYAAAQKNLDKGRIVDAEGQVEDEFLEGLSDGYENVTGGIKATLAAPFKFAFASIPWFYWLIALGALLWYMGGAVWLKGVIKR